MKKINSLPESILLTSSRWEDYELLDSGNGAKLERFGKFCFVRPEPQAMWTPALDKKQWESVHGIFRSSLENEGENGNWKFSGLSESRWKMRYGDISFWASATPFRHMGVFPEQAPLWDWTAECVAAEKREINVLNLFGYTGAATVALARAGAKVTHVDASPKIVKWARENQFLSGLEDKPIRWIVDDAIKFVRREVKRGVKYDGIIIDPPKFGRGPKGEIWKIYDSLPVLLKECAALLSEHPLFVVLTAYAVRISGVSLSCALSEMISGYDGKSDAGELVLIEKSKGRALSMAVFARWQGHPREIHF